MKNNFVIILLVALFVVNIKAKADSPLTSTDISSAYDDVEIVQLADKASGELTKDLMDYLYSMDNPIDVKIAVINKLSWGNMYNNSQMFFEYLQKKNGYKNINQFLRKANADWIICLAYLKALDDYFDVKEALKYAEVARKKNTKKSYTIAIVAALIEAQNAMDTDMNSAYTPIGVVENDSSLNKDMRDDAIRNIFAYMNLYKQ